jgi:1-acyl-sn-glycerol-3-phosphate acyltransferase
MLWVYPQGRRSPAAAPLAALERGAAWLLANRQGPVAIVPAAFRYPFLSEQRPEAFAWLGEPWLVEAPIAGDRRTVMEAITVRLGAAVAALDTRLAVEQVDDFATLVPGRLSLNNRFDKVRHALGLLPDYQARNG